MANMAATANQSAADQTYDFIIIGGGTAGCVLANRLSARSTSRVLVVEAGRDVAPGSEPADVMSTVPYSYYNPDYRWPDLKTYRGKRGSSSQIAITQARLLGGGSSVMGMIALRGTPADYAEWEAAGAAGWGWDDVLPYYKMLENDRDFDGDLHGKSGPVSIMRDDPSDYPPMTKAALDYARHSQVHVVDDFNGDFRDGLGTLPISRTKTRRAGSTACYLDASVRARANLTVLTDATVRQIHFDGTRAVGVSVAAGARTSSFRAKEIILSAGAVHSPALLLRAGVGPADALKTLGIGVVADRPGVGANFQNHPIVNLALQMMPHAVQRPPYGTHHHSWIRYSSQLAEMGGSDIGICFVNKTSWHDVGNRVGALSLILLKPLARGRVSLQSADPDEQPLTESNLLGDERDRLRMLEAMARGWEILNSNEVRPLWRSAYPVSGATWRKYLSSPSLFNSLFSTGIATMMDMSAAFGRWIVSRVSTDGVELEDVMKDPEKINRFITGSIGGMAHPVGTCRIGRSDDAAAVVDPQGRVYGTQGLRVADASLMPTLPRGNTNLPTTMIAEKVAAAMLH